MIVKKLQEKYKTHENEINERTADVVRGMGFVTRIIEGHSVEAQSNKQR